MSTPTLTILEGDCRAKLREIPDQSVQTCVTSPPYYGLRDYGVEGQIGLEGSLWEFLDNLVAVFEEVRRILKDDGTLWLNMGDSYAQNGGGGWQGKNGQRADRRFTACRDAVGMRDATRRPPRGMKAKDLMGQPWRLAFALQDAGWWLRQDIIWAKPAPMPESIRDRFTKSHEYLFLLAKSERYYFDQEAIKEPVSGGAHARGPGNKKKSYTTLYEETGDPKLRTKAGLVAFAESERAKRSGVNPKADFPDGWASGSKPRTAVAHSTGEKTLGRKSQDLKDADGFGHGPGWRNKQNASFSAAVTELVTTRNKRSVWTIPSEPYSGAHFATFPTGLVRPCILAGSKAGDKVLDPFFGSGTTGQVALELGRSVIGCELNPEYAKLARERCNVTPGLAL